MRFNCDFDSAGCFFRITFACENCALRIHWCALKLLGKRPYAQSSLFYEIRLRSLRVQASLLPLAGTNFAPFVGTKGKK